MGERGRSVPMSAFASSNLSAFASAPCRMHDVYLQPAPREIQVDTLGREHGKEATPTESTDAARLCRGGPRPGFVSNRARAFSSRGHAARRAGWPAPIVRPSARCSKGSASPRRHSGTHCRTRPAAEAQRSACKVPVARASESARRRALAGAIRGVAATSTVWLK